MRRHVDPIWGDRAAELSDHVIQERCRKLVEKDSETEPGSSGGRKL